MNVFYNAVMIMSEDFQQKHLGGGCTFELLHNHPESAEKNRELSHIDTYTQQRVLKDAVMPQREKRAL